MIPWEWHYVKCKVLLLWAVLFKTSEFFLSFLIEIMGSVSKNSLYTQNIALNFRGVSDPPGDFP